MSLPGIAVGVVGGLLVGDGGLEVTMAHSDLVLFNGLAAISDQRLEQEMKMCCVST